MPFGAPSSDWRLRRGAPGCDTFGMGSIQQGVPCWVPPSTQRYIGAVLGQALYRGVLALLRGDTGIGSAASRTIEAL